MRFRSTNSGKKEKAQRSGGVLRQPFILADAGKTDPVVRGVTVCFTGHRQIANAQLPALTKRLDDVLRALVRRGYRNFISGAALGFDTLAAERVLVLRREFPDVKLILAIPCSDQADRWTESQSARYEQMLYAADEMRVLAPAYYGGCMQVRNRYMVDRSSFCICFLERMKGGTLSTAAYALHENIPVLNVAMPDQCAAFIEEI